MAITEDKYDVMIDTFQMERGGFQRLRFCDEFESQRGVVRARLAARARWWSR